VSRTNNIVSWYNLFGKT